MPHAPVNELSMYYEVHGEGPPLVLLHGAYMTADMMAPLATGLADYRQVIVPELQAHGRTADVDRPLSYEQMGDDVAALIRHLGFEQADVVGYSMGGGAALQLAIRHPELVRRLVIASAGFRYDAMPPRRSRCSPRSRRRCSPGARWRRSTSGSRRTRTTSRSWSTSSRRSTRPTSPGRRTTSAAITAPTLIVLGDSDGVRLEHAVEMFKLRGGGVMGDLSGMPESQLAVLPGTSHFVPPGSGLLDRADWLLAMIPPFLDPPQA